MKIGEKKRNKFIRSKTLLTYDSDSPYRNIAIIDFGRVRTETLR